MSYTKEYVIDTGYVDRNRRLSLAKLFLMFQECAEAHAETIGTGRDKTTFAGRKWIITRHNVKIDRLPTFGETVKLTTYPGKNNPYFYYRYFYMEDEKGEIIIRGCSIWAILDASTNKIVANAFDFKLPEESRTFELPLPPKIEDDPTELVKEHYVEYSEIDLNGHLNNTKYIELIENLHDSNFYKDYIYDSVVVNYYLEIKEKEKVSLYLLKDNNKETIKGSVNEKDSFKAQIIYK